MSDCMTQEDAMNMSAEQAIQILKPMQMMMRDQHGCPISDAYFALGKALEALSSRPTDDSISRQAALDVLHGYFDGMLETDTVCPKDLYNEFEALPPVDAVEVVRCKDCKFSKPINAMVIECTIWADARLKADFCSAGERKERDQT